MSFDWIVLAAVVAIAVLLFYFLYQGHFGSGDREMNYETKKIKVGNGTVVVKIADSAEKRELGLMNASSLPENEGMLFVFDRPDYLSFWMKNTLIPLEIIFLDENYAIVDIQEMRPCSGPICKTYTSSKPARYAIELSENFSKLHNVSVGKKVDLIDQ